MIEYVAKLGDYLPLIFAFLMGFAIFIYVLLDGYDLGVGMLMYFATDKEKDRMVSSVGPFWDANETWLVLAVGLLLVAFPKAHGEIFSVLYMPASLMLLSLILRGVSFDFRIKADIKSKNFWNNSLCLGSLGMTIFQGYMLGIYVMGLEKGMKSYFFAVVVSVCLISAYTMMGSAWLIMKTEGGLQKKAVKWMKYSLFAMALNLALLSALTPLCNETLMLRLLTKESIKMLWPLPTITALLVIFNYRFLNNKSILSKHFFVPILLSSAILLTFFLGLAYSLYPYVILNIMTIKEAAADNNSLAFMLIGVALVMPLIIAYTILSYKIFWGKAEDLRYD